MSLAVLTLFNSFFRLLIASQLSIKANLIGYVGNELTDILPSIMKEGGDEFGLPGLRVIRI